MNNLYANASALLILGWALLLPACSGPAPAGPSQAIGVTPLASGTCFWQGASVEEGAWLECGHCVWRYCQCQPNGSWGNCTNDEPDDGACDWTMPDWDDPACSDGGTLPCDWTMPDWTNPSCQDTPPPGGGQACTNCHANGVPEGTPPPEDHDWL
ncbi:hypothetical protein ENSA7_70490 [Enhygromyxa salina]|uniref:Uncharacterized protein n=1 Tax=Enhygromyxa salina TaxID=215803 RepID=A0A2S9XTP0_9BACT|nr:hypothetical protein ENSA7_70490 [Enhygromyxa salina]